MTIREHLGFPSHSTLPKEQIAQRVSELAQLLGLQPLLIESHLALVEEKRSASPWTSPGARPSVLCLDEH